MEARRLRIVTWATVAVFGAGAVVLLFIGYAAAGLNSGVTQQSLPTVRTQLSSATAQATRSTPATIPQIATAAPKPIPAPAPAPSSAPPAASGGSSEEGNTSRVSPAPQREVVAPSVREEGGEQRGGGGEGGGSGGQ